jgi:SPP1 family predicted phage head-tail adaptor
MVEEYPHIITFQEKVEVPDGYGGYKPEWQDFRTIEAFVDPISGTRRYQAMQQTHPINHEVYYPFQDGITADMRAYWVDGGKTLKIQSEPIDQGGQGEIYMLECLLP